MSSAPAPLLGQVGWDWFSVQLNDGRQLMFYQMRRADGSVDHTPAARWSSTLDPPPDA